MQYNCRVSLSMKIILKISSSKFGINKKIIQSLHPQNKNMQRRLSHIETVNWFSPKADYTGCGACMLHE